jgi:glycosyltransferase involved in cell wall biosynthesis/predicted metal-dependent phosphoesterase TrpH
MNSHEPRIPSPARRIDLHCHSEASNRAAEVLLNAIHCPECYSDPDDVYAQAKRRGMDFVTITDHDTIEGVQRLAASRAARAGAVGGAGAVGIAGAGAGAGGDVLVGEELTCWFPEDRCKLHVLVYGIDSADHAELQRRAENIYDVAEYIESRRIAHAVAHPIYRQNDKLERWHVERLILLFKGFECLNGAHSPLHREAFEPVLDRLTPEQIGRLSETHGLAPRWPEPWIKARTGGSDDHGLLNIGRTWTEFPAEVASVTQVLECLRAGMTHPGGESGSSAKLAHTFYGIAVRYYSRHIMAPGATPNVATSLLQTIVGEKPAPKKVTIAKAMIRSRVKKICSSALRPLRAAKPQAGNEAHTAILKRLFLESLEQRVKQHPQLRDALGKGLPPLGEHEQMFDFVAGINRDVSEGLAAAISSSIDRASFTGLFDAIAAIMAQQFVLSPYYFSVFHQNKERHLLREITAQHTPKTPATLKVALFTDTFDEINGVGRFLRDMAAQARSLDRRLTIHTSCRNPLDAAGGIRKNFTPLLTRPLPYYEEITLNIPPVLEVLDWADRQQFDAVHVSTPGPMGLCGWLVAKMLRVPLLCTYHTDFPAYVDTLTRDHRITNGAVAYMRWFYGQAANVFTRSRAYRFKLSDLGVAEGKILAIQPGVDLARFSPAKRDPEVWSARGVREPKRLLYCGRVSVEKNLPMLIKAFGRLCERRRDAALVIAGDGPYLATMRKALAGLPAYFPGYQEDHQLAPLYASADLFVFPSRTDTLGQVVMEAQASGLPVLVSADGGPRESIDDGRSGMVLPGDDPDRWAGAMQELLEDEPRRQKMAHAAAGRAGRWSLQKTFDAFWAAHLSASDPSIMDSLTLRTAPVAAPY